MRLTRKRVFIQLTGVRAQGLTVPKRPVSILPYARNPPPARSEPGEGCILQDTMYPYGQVVLTTEKLLTRRCSLSSTFPAFTFSFFPSIGLPVTVNL